MVCPDATRAARLLAASIAARLPQAMLGIALMVHGERVVGSLAAGGLAAGGFALGAGVGGPWWGRRADRLGAAMTLLVSSSLQVTALVVTALLPVGTPAGLLVLCALAVGLATPPLGACLRAVLPRLVREPRALQRAYGAEASALELTFIAGPAIALGLAAATSTATLLMLCSLVLGVASTAYVVQARGLSAPALHAVPTGWAALAAGLRNRRLLSMTLVMGMVGVAFGATEVGVIAASGHATGSHASAGLLLALWGVGSLVGGAIFTWRSPEVSPRMLAMLLGVFAAGHLALAPASVDLALLAFVLAAAGAAIAPTFATVHALAGRLVREARATEAFAWIATATSCGSAAGAAVGGMLTAIHGSLALVLAGVAGVGTLFVARLARGPVVDVVPARAAVARERVLVDAA
jgi:MFS family permease